MSELQRMYKVENRSKVVRALQLMQSLDQSVVQALSQLDASVIRRSMAGNAEAQRVGEYILRRLTEFVGKTCWKTPPSSGKSLASSGLSRGVAEKRRSDDVSFRSGQPAEKMPRISDGGSGRGGPGFHRSQAPPVRSNVRALFDRPAYVQEPRPMEWMGPSGRGGMMRRGFPASGYGPPPRGGYRRGPYY